MTERFNAKTGKNVSTMTVFRFCKSRGWREVCTSTYRAWRLQTSKPGESGQSNTWVTSFRTATSSRNQSFKNSASFERRRRAVGAHSVLRRRPRSASLLSAPLSAAIKKFNKSQMSFFSICTSVLLWRPTDEIKSSNLQKNTSRKVTNHGPSSFPCNGGYFSQTTACS